VLVSTSGATEGYTGARAWADRASGSPVDAVLVLGDLAGTREHRPWVVPWSLGPGPAPLALQRTVEAAVRGQAGPPGTSRAVAQWFRRALPFTVSEQGVIADAGLPAVLVGVTGERGPEPGETVLRSRLARFGRSILRAVSAIDTAGIADGQRSTSEPAFADSPSGIVTLRNVLPDWAVRLLVGTLLLPALLTALDGFFRVRRRHLAVGAWLAWLGATGVPVVMAWVWMRALGITGALDPPGAPMLPLPPFEQAGALALGSLLVVLALGWFGVRPLVLARVGPRESPIAGGLAAATGALLCTLTALVWVVNPYAAALLLPAAHLWLFAAAPGTRLRGWAGAGAVAVGLAPFALAALYYSLALALDPLAFAWMALLSAASGELSLAVAIVFAALLACLLGVLAIMRIRRRVASRAEPEPLRTRGPAGYAGPGSLGGTESALRR
jgi:hypothetical protein